MEFVNLYTLTEYSLLESSNHIHKLLSKVKAYNYSSLGVCDINNTSGLLKFYNKANKMGIKPILGINISIKSDFFNSLLLYAKNNEGYKNLLQIASFKENSNILSLNKLNNKCDNIIGIIPSDENEIVKLLLENNLIAAGSKLNEYKNIINDLYLGIDLQSEKMRNNIDEIIRFADSNNVKCVAINKTVYLNKEDFDVFQVLRCIDLGVNEYHLKENEKNLYLVSQEEANYIFKDYPELIKNTKEISDKCNVSIDFSGYHLPEYKIKKGNVNDYFINLCKIGLNKRLRGKNFDYSQYKKRLFLELDVIIKMGFADYFLIVYDFIKYAKTNDILVGPGRGSAPGSLVAYVLGITDVDPLAYNLLFERFLNPERISMPDIDTDFPDKKRDQVIKYVGNKYGNDHVAHICTFGTFKIRMALRDVSKVLQVNEKIINEVLKFVKNDDDKINDLVKNNQKLKKIVEENSEIKTLVSLVEKIEGLPRHFSTHAAGIIITKEHLNDYTALQKGVNDLYQTQYDAGDLEKLGLLKMDFLGLKNLSIIEDVIEQINNNEEINFNINKIDLNDKSTFEIFSKGNTDGIFQFDSRGMKSLLMKLKTDSFDDIVNANALYRPGPMEMISSFVNRKFGNEKIEYIHQDLEDILKPTYGIIVFQEQIMLIAQRFAGYSLGQADILRRAVSKKHSEIIEKEREKFIQGSINNGYEKKLANIIYDYIAKFASYGFNKNHAVAYSRLAYMMAYLKKHYYKYFMVVLMSYNLGNDNLIKTYLNDCEKNNIHIKLPSINYSEGKFVFVNEEIYFPLLGIKGIGEVILKNFIEERNENERYLDYYDFINRTKKIFTKKNMEMLVDAGALDDFGLTRKQMNEGYEETIVITEYSEAFKGRLVKDNIKKEEYSFEEIANREREALGFNLKYSVFKRYEDYKQRNNLLNLADLEKGGFARVIVGVRYIRVIKTKKNDSMAFLQIYDDTDIMNAVLFPDAYLQYENELENDKIYYLTGNVEERNNELQFIIKNMRKER